VRSAEAEARGGLDEALRHCERIALQGKNNLFRAAQFLTARTRYHLFTSTYASMRVIDDAVDVSFLGLPADEKGWAFTEELSPLEYAEHAARWLSLGARIVGGCCGTRAEHTRALRKRLYAKAREAAGSEPAA